MNLAEWVRPNILNLTPYSSARDEFSGEAAIFLDANENPFNHPFNRYPDPMQRILKKKLSAIKSVSPENIFLGNGSDEPIDLIIRTFCEPGIHNIVQFEPTYGMYQVAAGINNIKVRKVMLSNDFQLDADGLLKRVTPATRVIFLCSPNNPTGIALESESVRKVLTGFSGPVVVDEAYIDFAPGLSWVTWLKEFSNLIILQTLSKAWGMAGIRLGIVLAHPDIIGLLNKIKYPYNVNVLTQQKALEQLDFPEQKEQWVKILLSERKKLSDELQKIPFIEKVWPTDANFFLVKMNNARLVYQFLEGKGIIVRDRSKMPLCENCLRITVGTPEENRALLTALKDYK